MARKAIYKFLRSGGSNNLAVNGSSTPVDFSYTPGPGKTLQINRINFRMRDATMRLNRFGGITTLINGLQLLHLDANGTILVDFCDGESVKDLDAFSLLAGIDNIAVVAASGDDTWTVRWTLAEAGKPYTIKNNETFVLKVRDDLTAITIFDAMLQGVLEY